MKSVSTAFRQAYVNRAQSRGITQEVYLGVVPRAGLLRSKPSLSASDKSSSIKSGFPSENEHFGGLFKHTKTYTFERLKTVKNLSFVSTSVSTGIHASSKSFLEHQNSQRPELLLMYQLGTQYYKEKINNFRQQQGTSGGKAMGDVWQKNRFG